MTPRLEVRDLSVSFATDEGPVLAVNQVSFTVNPGELLALVGESGCGKSMIAMSMLRLLPPTATLGGSIRLDGRELTDLPPSKMRQVRGREISMVFQEPMTSLNPAFTIGFQVGEVLRRHEGMSHRQARQRTVELLDLVRIPDPAARIGEYPHQLSGGMRQRVMIAIAVACNPRVLIADEPTTALDVTIQAQILQILQDLHRDLDTSIILITHDLGVVAGVADRVAVLYTGHKVEEGCVDDLFAHPQHPYTQGLLGAVPRPDLADTDDGTARLAEIPGLVPTLHAPPTACVFAPRCGRADALCGQAMPPLAETRPGQLAACYHPGALAETPQKSVTA